MPLESISNTTSMIGTPVAALLRALRLSAAAVSETLCEWLSRAETPTAWEQNPYGPWQPVQTPPVTPCLASLVLTRARRKSPVSARLDPIFKPSG